jgi:hypothetical protein
MMAFNLSDYVPVDERLDEFWKRHPEGRVWTDQVLIDFELGQVEFTCHLFTDRTSDLPVATGFAHEVFGSSLVNKTSAVENCETSAVGRALANYGIHGKRDGRKAPRASREEMEKVNRLEQAEDVEPVMELLDEPIRFGKHKGATWAEVLEQDRPYAVWAVENAKKMGVDLRATLKAALAGPEDLSGDTTREEGTTSGPPANEGQLAALRVAFGAIAIESDEATRDHVATVMALDSPSDD